MIDFSESQKKTIAAGLTVLAFAVVLAFVLFVGWVLVQAVSFASPALTPVFMGILLSMFFKPYYEWLHEKLHNPTIALIVMLSSVFVPLGCLLWFGGALVVEQLNHFIENAPSMIGKLSAWANHQFPGAKALLRDFTSDPGKDLSYLFFTNPDGFSKKLLEMLGREYGANAVEAGFGLLKYLTSLGSWLIVFIFFVYFLMRPPMSGADYVREFPFMKVETRTFIAKQIDAFLGILVNFFQRQVVICLIEGFYYGVGFMLVGLPYGFVVGFLLGALNLVPLLGTVTCLPLALPLAYFGDGGDSMRLVLVLVVWLVGQILDGYCITPKIQGEKTGLGYAGVIFSFFFWGVVFQSLLGLLLAIPLSAFCVVFWRAVKEKYFKGGGVF